MLKRINELSNTVKKKFIFNYDETSYNICNVPKTAIRIKGSDSVKINCYNLKKYYSRFNNFCSIISTFIVTKKEPMLCLRAMLRPGFSKKPKNKR